MFPVCVECDSGPFEGVEGDGAVENWCVEGGSGGWFGPDIG